MKFLIDDVNIEKIRDIYDKFPIDGITSNPSILSRYGKQPYKVLKEIREFIGEEAELHVQVISDKAEGMIVEAYKIIHTNAGVFSRKGRGKICSSLC
ncbi:transaldolase family protein [Caproiciproducens sp. MSJ-32]|uniref:transaldolase family protein n=1 Tax=Caproiciproducens sp. MSJ-32 TaxID=2841527 RepID=UPI003FA464A6